MAAKNLTSWFSSHTTEILLFVMSVLLSLGMLVTIAIWGHPPGHYPIADKKDSFEYFTGMLNLINGNGFSLSTHAPYIPESLRTPGYIVFGAFILAVFKSLYAISVVQALLLGCINVLVYRIALLFFRRNIALLAALFSLFNASLLFYSTVVLTDTLFLFLLLSSVYTLFVAYKKETRPSYVFFLASGCLLGLAVLVRPIGQLLPLVFIIGIALLYYRFSIRYVIIASIFFLITFVGIVGPWILRNDLLYGVPSLSSNGVVTLYFYNIPITHADRFHMSLSQAEEAIIPAEYLVHWRTGTTNDYRQLDSYPIYKARAIEYLKHNFVGYTIAHLERSLQFFTGNSFKPYTSFMGLDVVHTDIPTLMVRGDVGGAFRALWNDVRQGHVAIFFSILSALLWAIFLAGFLIGVLVSVLKNTEPAVRWFALFAFILPIYFAVMTGPAQSMRLRLQAEPFIFILSAAGLFYCYEYAKHIFQTKLPSRTTMTSAPVAKI